ncbi:recombinase family protein [Gudongella oleilytica]|uniref:recombinase family protein n=1 Tax=Gudongella oleilytica TaxID=1582259 RepID=UPI000FF8B0E4|nr:recombinase family protein [Gudongella oleilytica]
MKKRKKAVVYLRVSTSMQVDGYSLDAQRASIERYARAFDIDIIDVYKDEGRSGKSIAGREDFIRMFNDIEEGKIDVDYVMVFKLSRFGRNSADVLFSLQKLQQYNVNLICTEEGLNSAQAYSKMMLTVLSAVAELERDNIVDQTMSGRKQKASEGKWNGGFPPYGYGINEDDILVINDKEAEAIRIIYKKYLEGLGFNAISKYLKRQGIDKIPRKNGTLTQWSAKLIKDIIDNPVYCGKIAYGRRTKKKKKGTDNEYQTVKQVKDAYIIAQGKHESIISEEDWIKAQQRREETGVASPSSIGRNRVHILSGILRCPECGGPMYTNKNAWVRKDGTPVERHYYVCSRAYHARGIDCKYKASLREDVIEQDVIKAIKTLSADQGFEEEVKAKIGKTFDTAEIDKELTQYEKALKQATAVKDTLEREIDTLPYDAPHRDRKLQDLNKRLDKAYDDLIEVEQLIDDLKIRRAAIRSNALSVEQIYTLLENFELLFDKLTAEEKRQVISALVKEVEVTKEPSGRKKSDTKSRLRSITFNFPIYYDGNVGDKILWEKDTHVECVVLMSRVK